MASTLLLSKQNLMQGGFGARIWSTRHLALKASNQTGTGTGSELNRIQFSCCSVTPESGGELVSRPIILHQTSGLFFYLQLYLTVSRITAALLIPLGCSHTVLVRVLPRR